MKPKQQVETGAFSVRGAAAYLDVSENAIYSLLKAGKLTSFVVGKTGRRIGRKALDALINDDSKPGLDVAPEVSAARRRAGRISRGVE